MDPQIKIPKSPSARTYDLISAHYDDFTKHHDYRAWLEILLCALETRGLTGNRCLDAGCGTGKSTLPMIERGWQMTACDNSSGMLAQLRANVGEGLRVEIADLRRMPVLGEFDLIICLGDVLNYCAASGPLDGVLAGLAQNLAPGGLLLFDLNTLTTYRTFYAATTEAKIAGSLVRWCGQGDGSALEGEFAESVMSIDGPDGEEIRTVHRQRHVPQKEALQSLAQTGLACVDLFGQGFDAVLETPLEEDRHTKAVYIAAKNDPEEGR